MDIIRQELRNFVVQNFLFSEDRSLADSDSFLEKGIIDSTGILELVSFLEEKYGIVVEDRELLPENLDCISALVNFVNTKLTLIRPHAHHGAHQECR